MAETGKGISDRNVDQKSIPDEDVPKEEMNAWICKICDGVKTLLLQRQEHYGNTIGELIGTIIGSYYGGSMGAQAGGSAGGGFGENLGNIFDYS